MTSIISVRDLYKSYPYSDRTSTPFSQALFGISALPRERSVNVLKGISFELREGEVLGLLGPNGVGKTTLLRVLAGLTRYDGGEVELAEKPHAVLSLGNSFSMRMTGRDNAIRELRLLGLSGNGLNNAIKDIASFAGIGEYFDQELYKYSTGMIARLAFAIATSFSPTILLLDEALAVGDEQFFHRCKAKLNSLIKNGTTAVIATHFWFYTLQFASKVAWLKDGKFELYGSPIKVIPFYVRHYKLCSIPAEWSRLRINNINVYHKKNKICFIMDIDRRDIEREFTFHFNFLRVDDHHKFIFVAKLSVHRSLVGKCSIEVDDTGLCSGSYLINVLVVDRNGDTRQGVHENYNWILREPLSLFIGNPEEAIFKKRLQWRIV